MENTQWIFYGTESGGFGNRNHITDKMTEEEFLKRYGVCVSITSYFPVDKIKMKKVGFREKFKSTQKGEYETRRI